MPGRRPACRSELCVWVGVWLSAFGVVHVLVGEAWIRDSLSEVVRDDY